MLRLAVMLLVLSFAGSASAHSSPPALLQLSPVRDGIAVTFRVPRLDGTVPDIDAVLPAEFVDIAPPSRVELPDLELRRRVVAGPWASLSGRRVTFPGLDATGIDVLVRAGGERPWAVVARPATPFIVCPAEGSPVTTALSFLGQGVRHILFGPDHMLFVVGLMLLVRDRRSLLLTASSFTVAHSVTLAVAAYHVAVPPTPLVNALIALSLLYLAGEVAAAGSGKGAPVRRPWLAAFCFGLRMASASPRH